MQPRTSLDPAAAATPAAADAQSSATLRFLLSPQAHAPDSAPFELLETHMSWLVLDKYEVLKLKKPVCYPPHFDCRTLAAREHDARAELRLNRRLAPDVYLDVLAVQRDDGTTSLLPEAALPAAGRTVDWLVRMRRLPAGRMLDRMIASEQLEPAHVEALALTLARFYQQALPAPLDAEARLKSFRDENEFNRRLLTQPRYGLRQAAVALDRLDAAISRQADRLRQRVRQGHVVDGHGDLRAEHVCLVDPPVVIDCLAFADELRFVDPLEEIAALALDCDRLGASWVGPLLLERCAERLDDVPDPELLQLYRSSRALLRARLAVAHLLDAAPREPERWLKTGEHWIALALGGSAAG